MGLQNSCITQHQGNMPLVINQKLKLNVNLSILTTSESDKWVSDPSPASDSLCTCTCSVDYSVIITSVFSNRSYYPPPARRLGKQEMNGQGDMGDHKVCGSLCSAGDTSLGYQWCVTTITELVFAHVLLCEAPKNYVGAAHPERKS